MAERAPRMSPRVSRAYERRHSSGVAIARGARVERDRAITMAMERGSDMGGASFGREDRICARVEQSEAVSEALLELLGVDEFADPFDADVEAELRAMREAASHVTH